MSLSVLRKLLLLAVFVLLLVQLINTAQAQEQSTADNTDAHIAATVPTAVDQDEYDTARSTFEPAASNTPPAASATASTQQRKSRKLSSDFQASPLSQPTPKDKTRATTTKPLPSTDDTTTADFPTRLLSFGLLDAPATGWTVEIIAVTLVVLFIANFIYGRRVNDQLADRVFTSLLPLLSSQFAVVGAYNQHLLPGFASQLRPLSSRSDVRIYKESSDNYQLYCSGRRNCSGLLLTLECVKRHDLLSRLLSFFALAQDRDQLTVDVTLDAMQPFILALVKRKYETRMKKNVADLKMFTEVKKPQSLPLPATLSLMTDSVEACEAVLTAGVRGVLQRYEGSVILLHVSDQAVPSHLSDSRRVMHFKCYLPDSAAMVELITVFVGLVDSVTGVRLSGLAVQKAVERRRLAEELEAKKEREKSGDGKKTDAKKDETPEERAEREEKKRIKDAKKMKPRLKMMR